MINDTELFDNNEVIKDDNEDLFDIDSANVSRSDDITEAEFEALLDQLENKAPSSALSGFNRRQ